MLCPNFSDEKTLKKFSELMVRLGGKPLEKDHVANMNTFEQRVDPETLRAYHMAYHYFSLHNGSPTKITRYLDSLDNLHGVLNGETEARFGQHRGNQERAVLTQKNLESYSKAVQGMRDQSSENLGKLSPVAGYTSTELRKIGKYVETPNMTNTPEIKHPGEAWQRKQAISVVNQAGYYDADMDVKGYGKEVAKIMERNPNMHPTNILNNLIKNDGYPGYVKNVGDYGGGRWAFGFGKIKTEPKIAGKISTSEMVQGVSPQSDLASLIAHAHENAANLTDFIQKTVKEKYPEVKVSDYTPAFYSGANSFDQLEHSVSFTAKGPYEAVKALTAYLASAKKQSFSMVSFPVSDRLPETGRILTFDVNPKVSPREIHDAFGGNEYNLESVNGKNRVSMYLDAGDENLAAKQKTLENAYDSIGQKNSLKSDASHTEFGGTDTYKEPLTTYHGVTEGSEIHARSVKEGDQHAADLENLNQPGPPPAGEVRGGENKPGEAKGDTPEQFKATAKGLGIRFDGMQDQPKGEPLSTFTDPVTKSTFMVEQGGDVASELAKLREKWGIKSALSPDEIIPSAKKYSNDEVSKIIDPITSQIKSDMKIKVLNSKSPEDTLDLPANVKAHIIKTEGAGRDLLGMYDPKTKTSYLLSNAMDSPERIQKTMFHEMFHYGIPNVLGEERYAKVMDHVFKSMDENTLREMSSSYKEGVDLKARNNLAEEYLAHLAETNQRPDILHRVYAQFREALRVMGFDIKFSDNDISNLISKSVDFAKNGSKGGNAVEPILMSDIRSSIISNREKQPGRSEQSERPGTFSRMFRAVAPGLNVPKDGIKTVSDAVKSGLLPSSKSPEHLEAAQDLGTGIGHKNRLEEMNDTRFRPFSKFFNALGVQDKRIDTLNNIGMKFASDVSQGYLKNTSAEDIAKNYGMDVSVARRLQSGAQFLSKAFDQAAQWLDSAGVPIQQFRENYFPGMWTKESRRAFNQSINEFVGENPELKDGNLNKWTAEQKKAVHDRTVELLKDSKGSDKDGLSYLTRQPFEGKESFRKQKVFDDIMTGAEFGLRPIDANPFKLAQLKLSEMYKSAMANEFMKNEKEKGNVIALDNSGRPIDKELAKNFSSSEWQDINDKYKDIWYRNDNHELVKAGTWVAKAPVAEVLNNYLSASLYNNKSFGPLYRAWMSTANHLNQFQLGMGSAFHAGFTSAEAQVWAGANVLKDVYGVLRGNRSLGDLAGTVKEFPTAMVRTAQQGGKILKEFRNPDAVDVPDNVKVSDLPPGRDQRIAMIAKAAELSGGGFTFETGLRTNTMDKLMTNLKSGEYLKAAARSPFAGVEMLARPIMDFLVPRQKAGVFGEMVGRVIEMNPDKTLAELTPEFRQAWNKIDMSLGQVRYDRIFMNNAAKNVAQGMIRAPGWSGGTVALIGGVPKDVGKFFKEWHDTGKLPANIPDRFVYTASLLTMVTMTNALLTKALTGEDPTGMDYWAFRTGGKDDKGRDERFLLPTYAKDLFSYYENWGQTVLHKAHPLVGMMSEIMANKDYYGTEIRDANKPLPKQWLVETPKYVLKQFTPFWLRGAQKATQQSGGFFEKVQKEPLKVLGPEVGIMPASSQYTYSDAEKLINKYSTFNKTMTAEERRTADLHKEVVRNYRLEKKIIPEARDAVSKGYLTSQKLHEWTKEASRLDIVNKFSHVNSLGAVEAIWEAATPKEKKVLGPMYHNKKRRLRSLPESQ